MERIEGNLKTAVRKKLISEAAAGDARRRLSGTLTYDGFQSVDMVIEAAVEVRHTEYCLLYLRIGTN